MFGFLNIYKPKGLTSFDVIAKLRKITGIRQIGHTGTLDPFAQGVLVVCLGKSTKLIDYIPQGPKEYLATVQFGANTSTYDIEGDITEKFANKITKKNIISQLNNFKGEIEQIPPIYSAIKLNGKKLYDYARKGIEVEIKPRKITIFNIELKEFDCEKQQAKILINCSKGTYIRSIAYDLGKNLNCGGYLTDLIRTKSDNFSVENSLKLEDLKTPEDIESQLINPIKILNLPIINLNSEEKEKVSHGMSLKNSDLESGKVVFFIYNDKIYGLGRTEKDKILVKKVFG